MRVGFAQPILCPVVVGRDAYLAAIEQALDRVPGRTGEVILLTGEAGIGKSRLAAETRTRAAARDYEVFEGRCFEEDRTLPYAPLRDLLQTYLATVPAAQGVQRLGPAAEVLASLLPELGSAPALRAPSFPHDTDLEKHHLFQALAGFFTGRAGMHPVLLVVEDLHWSDEPTLDFLLYLARRIAQQPILLLLTYRADEAPPGLEHFLAAIARGRLGTELALARLPPADVAAMLRAIFALDRPPGADFLDTICTLTDGNPFFIEEVLKSLVAAGDIFPAGGGWDRKPVEALRVPRTVEDAVRRRLAQLSEAARETLQLAAVTGVRFDFALLKAVTGYDEQALLSQIKELRDAQLIVEEPGDRFAFRHALTRQAVYGQLLAREQRTRHRQIADALERLTAGAPAPPLSEIAHHFYAAGTWPQALDYSRRAGEQALAMQATRAAAEHFTHALQAAEALGMAPEPALYRGRGLAHETLGAFESARQDQEAALAAARHAGDAQAEWQALLDLGFLWSGRDLVQAGTYFRQALAQAQILDEPTTLARSLNRLGNWYFNSDALLEAQRHHEQALTLFEAAGDRRGIAETLDLLALVTAHIGPAQQSERYFARAIAAFEELGDRRGLASVLAMAAQMDGGSDRDAALPARRAERAVQLAREIGWPAGEAFALATLAWRRGARGEFAPALAAARNALAIAEDIEHQMWTIQAHNILGFVYAELLALPVMRQHLESAAGLAQEIGSPYWVHVTTAALAQTYLLGGDPARAEAVLNSAFGEAAPGRSLPQQICRILRADLALLRGKPAQALAILAPLLDANAPGLDLDFHSDLWRIRAEALLALQRTEEAEAVLLAAREAAAREEARARLWRIHRHLGQFYARQGRAADAERAVAAARTLIESLAAEVPDEPLPPPMAGSMREHFFQAATALLPPPRRRTPRQAAKEEFGGLTEREREVAVLIAQGRSNREIAEVLVIGPRTVQTHISNIFAKLGCDSRAQVAAWVVAHGLLPGSGSP